MAGIAPEAQQNEYKSSWHDEYLAWICGYANSRGGNLYVGVNDDGYVVGLADTRYLLDELPNVVSSTMGIVIEVDHRFTIDPEENIKHGGDVPADIACKPQNLYVRGVLTAAAIEEIDANPSDITGAGHAVRLLYGSAPNLVRQLRRDPGYRGRVLRDVRLWDDGRLVRCSAGGVREYVCISVRPYPYGISHDGHYYLRSGGTNREMIGLELSTFLMERAGRHWDGMPMPGMSPADLDPMAIEAYRRKAVATGRRGERDVDVPDAQVVSDLKLLDESHLGNGAITRAAVLMFHRDPERYVTGAYVKVAYFAPTGAYGANATDDIIYQDEVHGPLITQADSVTDLVYAKYLKALTSYEGLQRLETYMSPKGVFREVILNAINHKVYESGNPVQVSVYEDRVVVFNQGRWPEDITLDSLYTRKHSSYPHNPSLSHVFFNAGEIEAYGGGFDKIRIECDRVGAPYPAVEVTPNGVTVTILASEAYTRLLGHGRYWQTFPEPSDEDTPPQSEEIVDVDNPLAAPLDDAGDAKAAESVERMSEILSRELSEREKAKFLPIYEHLKISDTVDLRTVARLTGRSPQTAGRYLKRLVELSVLAMEGRGRATVYRRI